MVKALLSLLPLPGRERKIPGDQATPLGGRVGEAAWPENQAQEVGIEAQLFTI